MKWFKHFTHASNGDTITKIEREFGLEGYARWFKLLEIIGRGMDGTDRCSAKYHINDWCAFLKCKPNKFRTFVERLADVSETFVERSGNVSQTYGEHSGDVYEIKVPNLLKIRDEYSKKSGQDPESVRPKEGEGNSKEENTPSCLTWFEEDWAFYPRKEGNKKKSFDCYKKSVGLDQEKRAAFRSRVEEMKKARTPKYYPHAETFFRNWQDLEFDDSNQGPHHGYNGVAY